jgi:hypothetical protein
LEATNSCLTEDLEAKVLEATDLCSARGWEAINSCSAEDLEAKIPLQQ